MGPGLLGHSRGDLHFFGAGAFGPVTERPQVQFFFRQTFERLTGLGWSNRQAQKSLLLQQQREGCSEMLTGTFAASAVP
ncbi:hypothetical protein ETAA8_03920 [Anatilimnocola aggregata]|uniref:Uncharacterized protein n=1 Tax=Anatilimnocola aggregata TaxID=2528021 RepID=A0A517Y515_9BACT|nr:hypothetical protein ETAA8_03920 [Anatilimnocola aggregata]